jgi:hypothetical protein
MMNAGPVAAASGLARLLQLMKSVPDNIKGLDQHIGLVQQRSAVGPDMTAKATVALLVDPDEINVGLGN